MTTSENYPVVFVSDEDYKKGVSILGLCTAYFNNINLYAYSLMSNHIHLLVSGTTDEIAEYFDMYRKILSRTGCGTSQKVILDLQEHLYEVSDDNYMRNVIAYIHRNAFVVNPDYTPFSYPWSSGMFCFNPEALKYVAVSRKILRIAEMRRISKSRKFDDLDASNLYEVDGCICGASFCRIDVVEGLFLNAREYFYRLSRNIEATSNIAKQIGEKIILSDSEIYGLVCKLSNQNYGGLKPADLSPHIKLELAKKLHYEYNSSSKQLARIFKIDESLISVII